MCRVIGWWRKPYIGMSFIVASRSAGCGSRHSERYFVIHSDSDRLSREGWTADEVRVMADHRWWSVEELQMTSETVWPERLIEILEGALVKPRYASSPL